MRRRGAARGVCGGEASDAGEVAELAEATVAATVGTWHRVRVPSWCVVRGRPRLTVEGWPAAPAVRWSVRP